MHVLITSNFFSFSEPDIKSGNCEDLLPVVSYKKWPACPGSPQNQYLAQLRRDTLKIKKHYSEFSNKFLKTFLSREERKEVEFDELYVAVQNLFDFEDEYMESFESNSKKLLLEILKLQSYLNFDLIQALICQCGTAKDIQNVEIYTEAFKQYAKRRIFECDVEVLGKELPGHETVMFVLDKKQSSRLKDVYDFKENLCELLGIKPSKILLHEVGIGSIIISIQIPSKLIRFFNTLPLFQTRMLSLKEWHTKSYKLKEEIVHLSHWNVLNSVDFGNVSVVHAASAEILPIVLDDREYLALKYTKSFSDESTADVGYIKYLDVFLSGKYKNIPAVKGVYYHQSSEEETHHYPTIVVENLKSLEEASTKQEISTVTQISLLSDITCSVASFESDQRHQVSVFPDSVFVQDSVDPDSGLTARFCPLYGHSFHIKHINLLDQPPPSLSTSLPLEQLQWMSNVVKFIHFQGNVKTDTDLPEDHILKKLFDHRWISAEDRFRPPNFKSLSEELQHLLGKFSIITIVH